MSKASFKNSLSSGVGHQLKPSLSFKKFGASGSNLVISVRFPEFGSLLISSLMCIFSFLFIMILLIHLYV